MKIRNCCCCLSTRIGAYAIAIFGVIRGMLYLSYLILLMNAHEWRPEGKHIIIVILHCVEIIGPNL